MAKRVKISVTQDHIENGFYGLCDGCPVALALKEAGYHKPYVSAKVLAFGYTRATGLDSIPKEKLIPLPRSAQKFIRNFDAESKVEPFNFFLELK